MDQRQELPSIQRFPFDLQFGLQRVGKREIHWVPFFTAMPRPVASEVAETSGAAARVSTAAAAREWRRRPDTARRAANQARSIETSKSSPSSASSARASRNTGSQASRCHGVSGRNARSPVSGTGTRRRRWWVQNPGSPIAAGEQRGGAGRREDLSSALHCAFLIECWCDEPLVQVERMAGGVEDGTAVDDAERTAHAEAQPLEYGGKVPGIDRLAVDRGLRAYRLRARLGEERPGARASTQTPDSQRGTPRMPVKAACGDNTVYRGAEERMTTQTKRAPFFLVWSANGCDTRCRFADAISGSRAANKDESWPGVLRVSDDMYRECWRSRDQTLSSISRSTFF